MNEVSKNLMCIVMRSGVQIWLEKERVEKLMEVLKTIKESKFIELDGETLNTADVSGIFKPGTMEDFTRRKNGYWQCDYRVWHEQREKCECLSLKQIKIREENRQTHRARYGVDPLY